MASVDEVRAVVRDEITRALNLGTAQGQLDWAGTSKATLATVQTLVNLVRALPKK